MPPEENNNNVPEPGDNPPAEVVDPVEVAPEPVEPEVVDPGNAPEPAPQYTLPGGVDPAMEAAWLRQQYGSVAARLAQTQAALEELELRNLEPEEAERVRVERERDNLSQRLQHFEQQQVLGEWRGYWSQFVPGMDLNPIQDPVDMGHRVVTTLAAQNQALQREVAALKKALPKAAGGGNPPPVTTGGSGSSPKRRLMDLTPSERESLRFKARMGLLSDGEIPGI